MMNQAATLVLLALSTLASPTVASGILQDIGTLQQQQRRTQDVDPCTANGGDLLSVRSFYTGSLGQCQCAFANDLESLENFDQEALGDPETNDNFINEIVGVINDLLRSLRYSYSNECAQSNCETCFGPVCGTITASEKILVEGNSDTNLTFTDLLTLPGITEALNGGDPDELTDSATENVTALTSLFGPNLSTENSIQYCMAFTTEFTGSACLEVANILDGEIATEFSDEAQDCTLQYNGQTCSSCEFSVAEGASCVTADCTGIAAVGTMVDTCAGTGMVGPMQFLDGSAAFETTCAATSVVTTCEGLGCSDGTTTDTDPSGAFAVSSSSLVTASVAAVVALMM